jgi:hypothetical protein
VEKSDYLDLDIAAAPAIPIGIIISIHNQFIDESSFGVAGVAATGTAGTVTFCLSESMLTFVTAGSVGNVTPFVTFSKPVTRRVGKVTPLRTFCLKVDGGLTTPGPLL